MRGADSGTLLFDSDIDKTEQQFGKQSEKQHLFHFQVLVSSDKEMRKPECITLGDYGRLETIDKVGYGFKPMNPVLFDIKHSVLVSLRYNQF